MDGLDDKLGAAAASPGHEEWAPGAGAADVMRHAQLRVAPRAGPDLLRRDQPSRNGVRMTFGLFHRIKAHSTAWTAFALVIMAAALWLRAAMGTGYHLGDLAALMGMFAGTLLMLRAPLDSSPTTQDEED